MSKHHASPAWRRLRLEILKRDNWTCQKCHQHGGRLEVHHTKRLADSGHLITSDPEGLITYCVKCHIDHHRRDRNKLSQEWDAYFLARYGYPMRYNKSKKHNERVT